MTDATDPGRRKNVAGAAAAGVGLVVVLVAGSILGSDFIETDLTPTSRTALDAAGLESVNVEFTGREAVLTGGTTAQLAEAKTVVENVYGVRWATVGPGTDPGTAEPRPTSQLTVSETDDTVVLGGTVPSQDIADQIQADAEKSFGKPVTNNITVDPDASDPTWAEALPEVFDAAAPVDDLQLTVTEGSAELGGEVGNDAERDSIGAEVEKSLDGDKVKNELQVTSATLSAADAAHLAQLTVLYDPDSLVVDEQGAAVLDQVAAIMLANPDISIEVRGNTSPDPDSALSDNVAFSVARAQSAADYLISRGIPASHLKVTGVADTQPVADNGTDAGRASNRRVNFYEQKASD